MQGTETMSKLNMNPLPEVGELQLPAITAETVQTVKVQLNFGPLVEDLARNLSREVTRVLRTGDGPLHISVEEMTSYVKSLIILRVLTIHGAVPKEYHSFCRNGRVPSILTYLLFQIGEALDREFGIKYVPYINQEELASLEMLRDVSERIALIADMGFHITHNGVPQSVEGDLAFMSMDNDGEVVRGTYNSHPVFGLLACFFVNQLPKHVRKDVLRNLIDEDKDTLKSSLKDGVSLPKLEANLPHPAWIRARLRFGLVEDFRTSFTSFFSSKHWSETKRAD